MHCQVEHDTFKHYQQQGRSEARQEAIDNRADELAHALRMEYNRTGGLEMLSGDDPREYLEEGETLGAYLDREALEEVERNPSKYFPEMERG